MACARDDGSWQLQYLNMALTIPYKVASTIPYKDFEAAKRSAPSFARQALLAMLDLIAEDVAAAPPDL